MQNKKKIKILLLAVVLGFTSCTPLLLKGPDETKAITKAHHREHKHGLIERISYKDGLVSCELNDDDLQNVLILLSRKANRNIVFSERVYSRTTASLRDMPFEQAFKILINQSQYKLEKHKNYYLVKEFETKEENPIITKNINLRFIKSDKLIKSLFDSLMPINKTPMVRGSNQQRVFRTAFMMDAQESFEEEIKVETSTGKSKARELSKESSKSKKLERKEAKAAPETEEKTTIINTNLATHKNTDKNLANETGKISSVKKNRKNKKIATRINKGSGNSIVISGRKKEVDGLLTWIAKMDIEIPQVYFETEIIEFDVLALKSLGINVIDFINGVSGVTISTALDLKPQSAILRKSVVESLALSASGQEKLDFLVENTHAKIIGHPTIKVRSGKRAKISFKEKRFVQIKAVQAAELREVEAGVSLTITPQVTSDNSILVDVLMSQSLFLPDVTESILASTSISEASTQLKVLDGEAIIIGGIITERNVKNTSGVPYLKNIPVLGYIFGKTNIQTERIETIFKIVPHLINNKPPI